VSHLLSEAAKPNLFIESVLITMSSVLHGQIIIQIIV
jgi:hypothetical protein